MMWLLFLLYIPPFDLVFSQDNANRLILKKGNNPCEGHLEIYHKGQWEYVGDKNWNRNTEEVACRSTHCGEPLSSKEVLRPTDGSVGLNEITCKGNESHLWDCKNPGFGISIHPKDTMRKITCSNEIKISLNGFKCKGAVQYTTDGGSNLGYFCNDNWGLEEANLLCKSLGCGKAGDFFQPNWVERKDFDNAAKMSIKCSGIDHLDNLWQCATTQELGRCSDPAAFICTGHQTVRLTGNRQNVCHGQLEIQSNETKKWFPVTNSNTISPEDSCQQMFCGTNGSQSLDDKGMQLNCTDNVTVLLIDNNPHAKCYGTVHITLNGANYPVCASTWTKNEAEVVCRELNCGKVISSSDSGSSSNGQSGIMDNVECSGNEWSLWHCSAKRQNNSCTSFAYVICAGSVDVRLTDSPGRCAGRVEIKVADKWQRVPAQGWTETNSDKVCNQLKCGKSQKNTVAKFNQGTGDFLTMAVNCPSNAGHISECITEESNIPSAGSKAVSLICDDHISVFLIGNNSCSGFVGIKHNDNVYRLSGSKKTWNKQAADTVCQHVHCGVATNFSSSASNGDDVWDQSYNCSSNTTSLLKCENVTLPPDHKDVVATVTCSGNITVDLTNGCWGKVRVCMGTKCGGVCKDTWSDSMSQMLCKSLGCGNEILHPKNPPVSGEVMITCFQTPMSNMNLNNSIMIINDGRDTTCNPDPAYATCSDSVKFNIKASRYKCSGNVEVFYEDEWLPVCKDALKDVKTQNAICGELKCGQAFETVDYLGLKTENRPVISQISCSGNGNKTLAGCNILADNSNCILGGLRCSNWRKMELKFNKSCSGAVFVYSKGQRSAVSMEGWSETEGTRLCQDLQCGNFMSKKSTNSEYSFWNGSFSCENVKDPKSIWDCEKSTLPSYQQQQQLNIECQDEPEVTLSEKCAGEVRINNISVCSSNWNLKYSHLVCQEKYCSNAVFFEAKGPPLQSQSYHVTCEDYHDKLGQCNLFKGQCNGRPVSVYCAESVKFNTTEECGGQIQVNYRNRWETVCQLPSRFKETLCQDLACNGFNNTTIPNSNKVNLYKAPSNTLDTTIICTAGHTDIKHCIFQTRGTCNSREEIYCNKYEWKLQTPPSNLKPLIIGVGSFLVLVILIVIVGVKKLKRKKLNSGSSRMLSKEEIEFGRGDYEEVRSKVDDTDNFGLGSFRPETRVITVEEEKSNSSFPYDDVEVVDAQPLTSEASTVVESQQNYLNESVPDENTDGVTYEVNDPQETYDDIGACSEVVKSEVHNSHQSTPENFPGLVNGDEDYLVPDQDA